MASWGHAVRRLTTAEADYKDRWGHRCGTVRCRGVATSEISYDYVTGRRGRVSSGHRAACDTHAQNFATKHHIEITPAPTTEPRRGGIIAQAAAAFAPPPPRYVTVEYDNPQAVTLHGGASLISGTCWLGDLPTGSTIDEALPAAQAALALRHRLVLTEPWTRGSRRACAAVASAEDTEPWSNTPWTVTVAEGERGVWQATTVLAPHFLPHRELLGDTGMDLDRAIRTAQKQMRDGWSLGDWTRDAATATTTAIRKAVEHASA